MGEDCRECIRRSGYICVGVFKIVEVRVFIYFAGCAVYRGIGVLLQLVRAYTRLMLLEFCLYINSVNENWEDFTSTLKGDAHYACFMMLCSTVTLISFPKHIPNLSISPRSVVIQHKTYKLDNSPSTPALTHCFPLG